MPAWYVWLPGWSCAPVPDRLQHGKKTGIASAVLNAIELRSELGWVKLRWSVGAAQAVVLKTNGYNLEHSFGHGKQTLASMFLILNLLAVAFHTAALLTVLTWRQALAACGATYRFVENLRTSPLMSSATAGTTYSRLPLTPPSVRLDNSQPDATPQPTKHSEPCQKISQAPI